MSTFTVLDRERLGNGILEIEDTSATAAFSQQVIELTRGDSALHSMQDVAVAFYLDDGLVRIDSKATIQSSFNQPVQVEHSLEFVIDPTMEDS